MRKLWVSADGSYGVSDFAVFDITYWTEQDWEDLENAADWQRLQLAHVIHAKYQQREEENLCQE